MFSERLLRKDNNNNNPRRFSLLLLSSGARAAARWYELLAQCEALRAMAFARPAVPPPLFVAAQQRRGCCNTFGEFSFLLGTDG